MKEKISKISLRIGLCLLPIVAALPIAMPAKVFLIIGLFMFLLAFGFLFFTLFINATFWFTAEPEPFQTILKVYIIATVAAFSLALISEIVYLIVKAIKNRRKMDVK